METYTELEYLVAARLADHERGLESQRWNTETRWANREQREEPHAEPQRPSSWGVPAFLRWLALPGRFGSP